MISKQQEHKPRRNEGKRRISTKATTINTRKKQESFRMVSNVVEIGSRFCFVLELGSALVWTFLTVKDVFNLLQACSNGLSDQFTQTMSVKAISMFAEENNTHLGRQCGCDWMRSLDFVSRSSDECDDGSPFTLDETMPILQAPGGPHALLSALFLTKNLLRSLCRRNGATFVPVVCPLLTKTNKLCPTIESNVKQVMNRICHGAGTRFFYEFQQGRGRAILDYLDQHWSGIEDSSCQYCDSLTLPRKNFTRYSLQKFQQLRTNCREVYRPLKSGMLKDLELVRFVPRPRRLQATHVIGRPYYGPYEGLVAGVKHGILCGFYLVNGFKSTY